MGCWRELEINLSITFFNYIVFSFSPGVCVSFKSLYQDKVIEQIKCSIVDDGHSKSQRWLGHSVFVLKTCNLEHWAMTVMFTFTCIQLKWLRNSLICVCTFKMNVLFSTFIFKCMCGLILMCFDVVFSIQNHKPYLQHIVLVCHLHNYCGVWNVEPVLLL